VSTRAIAACVLVASSTLAIGSFVHIGRPPPVVHTSTQAFVSTASRLPLIALAGGRCRVRIGITPAPWPEEAGEIWRRAGSRRGVTVVVDDIAPAFSFEIVGREDSGVVLAKCNSRVDAEHIVRALSLRGP